MAKEQKTSKKETVTEMKSPDGSIWELFVTDGGVMHISKKESK